MILELVDKNNPILRQKMPVFDFENPPCDPIELSKNLAETMISNNGLGLAANQVGLPYRAFVMMNEQIIACFNPKVVDISTEEVMIVEGCLSYPGLAIKIKRPRMIKVRYTMPNGETVTEKFDGLTSRVFQHEFDHLEGHVHIDLAHPFHLEQAMRGLKKHNRIIKVKKELII